jgi:radical SAM superfamily enzyme
MINAFIDSDENTRTELSLAYAQHATKKFQSFTNTYLVNEVARSYFQSAVYAGGVA